MSNQNGKGSKPRPVNKKEYDKNFDKIFGKKKDFNLREFAEMKGIKNLSNSLLKLENTISKAISS